MSTRKAKSSEAKSRPRIVIHGGAGNITHKNLSPASRREYLSAIAHVLDTLQPQLVENRSALDIAVEAVKMLEDDPLFNAGKGAVFTLDGKNELEASVMVSRGAHKRCAGVFLLKHVKNPILLAKELLLRDSTGDGEGERGRHHNCLSGKYVEELAQRWGLEIVDQSYFYTEKRWKQHIDDLKNGERLTTFGIDDSSSEDNQKHNTMLIEENTFKAEKANEDHTKIEEYLPKGTVGCVVLDSAGVIAVATSTGGLTNKVPGRIGDTPTPGAGFWAEEWPIESPSLQKGPIEESGLRSFKGRLVACLPLGSNSSASIVSSTRSVKTHRSVGISGTGNGDYFLRLSACHNISSRCRFGGKSLQQAAKAVVGPGGEMEQAGEGRKDFGGAIIGIDDEGTVVMEMNCGGCFRGTIDDEGRVLVAAFADEQLEELKTG